MAKSEDPIEKFADLSNKIIWDWNHWV